ncbi:MAG TPA: HK97 gp10 family phage protein [Chloroflexota bacterium]
MISFTVEGDQAVVRMLSAKVPKLTNAVRGSITRATFALVAYVKANKLSGQVLKNRTGTLRRKINGRVTETANSITGIAGLKLAYAAAHEYGLDVDESVRAHLRTIKQAFGRSIAPVTFEVKAHSRHVHLPERSYLRSSLSEMTPEIQGMIRAAVVGAARA